MRRAMVRRLNLYPTNTSASAAIRRKTFRSWPRIFDRSVAGSRLRGRRYRDGSMSCSIFHVRVGVRVGYMHRPILLVLLVITLTAPGAVAQRQEKTTGIFTNMQL